MKQKCIALLGRRDQPTDAIEEYCHYLSEALRAHDFDLQIARVRWNEQDWDTALRELQCRAKDWTGQWVLVQYTALAWSARGFPLRFLRVLKLLHKAGARIAVVFHDVQPYEGQRIVDVLRRRAQLRTMCEAVRVAQLLVFTVTLEKISWITKPAPNAVFIPVGANLSIDKVSGRSPEKSQEAALSVAVFGITGGDAGLREIESISNAMRFVSRKMQNLRLVVLGRNSEDAAQDIRNALRDLPVEICIKGLLSSEDVAAALSSAEVLLFVRGHLSTRRGSAIAGIACGLPIVAFAGVETAAPITEAGIAFYSPEKKDDLGMTLLRVLENPELRASLAERSRLAQENYFSWPAIAARYAEVLQKT